LLLFIQLIWYKNAKQASVVPTSTYNWVLSSESPTHF